MNIILAHGFLGFKEKFGVEYFAHITEFLKQLPAQVVAPEVDPTAGFRTRGEQLRSKILEAFRAGDLDPSQKAHIIAHSMGGLDCRYLLSPQNELTTPQNDVAPRIASLTTVSTPHRGSPVADLVALKRGLLLPHLGALLSLAADAVGLTHERLDSVLGDLGISEQGLLDLTTEATRQFNQTFRDHGGIPYRSVAGHGRQGLHHTALLLEPLFLFVSAAAREPNDGLVTVSSAQYGTFDHDLWPTDHADEIGHNLDNLAAFDAAGVHQRYMRIVNTFSNPDS